MFLIASCFTVLIVGVVYIIIYTKRKLKINKEIESRLIRYFRMNKADKVISAYSEKDKLLVDIPFGSKYKFISPYI